MTKELDDFLAHHGLAEVTLDDFLVHYTTTDGDTFELSTDVAVSLAHAGVKGMKWGVRKDKGHEGKRASQDEIDKADRNFATDSGAVDRVFNSAYKKSVRYDIAQINAKPEYKDLDMNKPGPLRDRYMAEQSNTFLQRLANAAHEEGTNASGTVRYGIYHHGDGAWELVLKDAAHASDYDSLAGTMIDVVIENGFIVDLIPKAKETLAHAGVKGMKWGVRKDDRGGSGQTRTRQAADATKAIASQTKAKSKGTGSLSNKELKALIERQNLEQQYARLNPSKTDRAKKLLIEVLENQGKQIVGKYVNKGVEAAIGQGVTAITAAAAARAAARV